MKKVKILSVGLVWNFFIRTEESKYTLMKWMGNVRKNTVEFTSTTGSFNNHRGVHIYGQSGVTINNYIFENGFYGIFAWLAPGGALLTISK